MFLASQISFDELKVLAVPFVGIFIPLLIAYKVGKKTNFLVSLLTLMLYSVLIFEFQDTIKGISEPLGGLLQEAAEVYLAPVILIFNGAFSFIGLGDIDPILLYGALWLLFLVLAIIGNYASPIKFINSTINTILGIVMLVLLVMYILDYNDATAQALIFFR